MPLINSSFTARIHGPIREPNLLEYLCVRFPYHTRDQWLHLLSLGRLELDGNPASPEIALKAGQRLRFAVVDYMEPDVPTDFRMLATEPEIPAGVDLRFVHKPAGMPVHRTGRIFFQTLANLLRERLGDATWSPLNRLDRETSGIIPFGRGSAIRDYAPFQPGTTWTKLYVAVVRGSLLEASGHLDQPLCEREGDPLRCRMHPDSMGKKSLSVYEAISTRNGFSLVILAPITGRKHQLRAHLAAAGNPIVGDKIYSLQGRPYLKFAETGSLSDADFEELGASHQLLHSFYLRIGRETESGPGAQAWAVWDWEMGEEFDRYFDRAMVGEWAASPRFRTFLSRVEGYSR